jgi:hypothetical protein
VSVNVRRLASRSRFAWATLILGACITTTPPMPVPSAPPTPGPTAVAFEIKPDLWMNDDPYPLRGQYRTDGHYRADGDITLTFRLDFPFTTMDRDSVVAAVRRSAPEAVGFRWDNYDQSVRFDIAAGSTPITIDPSGARSTTGAGTVAPVAWTIARPATEVALYDPVALVRDDRTPARVYRFALTPGGLVQFDPSGEIALLWHGSVGRPGISFVEVASGRRTPLPWDLAKIASNGSRQQWLPDGRFLTIGSHDTIIAGHLGENMRWLTPLVGQGGIVSPSGTKLAVWSYAENTAAIVDLDSGAVASLGGGYLRCNVGGGVSLAWSPDGRTVAISHCTRDLRGPSRTSYIDVASARTISTVDGTSVLAWLPDGRKILQTWSPSDDLRRPPDPTLRVVDAAGRLLTTVTTQTAYAVSPDGRWLLDFGTDPQRLGVRVIDLRDGRAYPLPDVSSYATWTPFGLIAVSRAAP